MTNYFMLYTPFHLSYALRIIEGCHQDDENKLINHYKRAPTKSAPHNAKEIQLGRNLFRRILGVRAVKKELLELAKKKEEINIFIPHTLGILSNYSYHKLAKKYNNLKINIFYEGVIVFYIYDHHYLENIGYYISRWMLGLFCGISYTIDKRLLDFHDQRVNKIYTPFTSLDAPADKIVEVGLGKIQYTPVEDSALILGLILEKKYMGELRKIIEGIYRKLDDLHVKTIYFKDHPLDKCKLYPDIAKEVGKTLRVIENTAPIETIIAEYCPRYVISLWSSGIINLRNMLPKEINMYIFVTEKLTETEELKKLVIAFQKQNIEVIYL